MFQDSQSRIRWQFVKYTLRFYELDNNIHFENTTYAKNILQNHYLHVKNSFLIFILKTKYFCSNLTTRIVAALNCIINT